jgi:hypothetical protein
MLQKNTTLHFLAFHIKERQEKMKKTLNLVISVFIIAWATLAQSISAEAGMRLIPGKTEADYALNLELLKNDNEDEVILYLSDSSPDVRIGACMRLGEIGTSDSLDDLLDVAKDVTEEADVKKEAAYAYWNIRYKEDIKVGNNGGNVLIAIMGGTTGDETITPGVKAWAIDILGNMGLLTAIPYLETIRDDETITPYSPYLKEKAQEALAKINFINSFPPEADPFAIIDAGLAHAHLYIRQWAVRYLVEVNPADLLDRLNTIYNTALANGDSEFASYVGMILADEYKKNRETSIEILTPRDGVTVKTPRILIIGHIRLKGEIGAQPFSDIVELPHGEYTYTKRVTDKYANTVSQSITVYLQNEDPILDPIGDKQALAGEPLTFNISASDPDGDNIIYFASDLPDGATFDYDTQTFSWLNPALGTYNVKFRVRDGWGLKDEEEVAITVNNINKPPILSPIGSKTVNENELLTFTVSATDPDSDALTYSATGLPQGAILDPDTHTFSWKPTYYQAGAYTITFSVSDGSLLASEIITITVKNVNGPPQIEPIGNKTVNRMEWLRFKIKAADPDGDKIAYYITNKPQAAHLNSRTGEFAWRPSIKQAGEFKVTFIAKDSKGNQSQETITITVPNSPPILRIGNKTVKAGQLRRFRLTAKDPDGIDQPLLRFYAENLPEGARLASSGVFIWKPNKLQIGSYKVRFYVKDPPGAIDDETVTITVRR